MTVFNDTNQMIFYSKIFIFGQVMVKNGTHAHIWAYVFWPIWKLRRLLSIDWYWKIQIMVLIFDFWFLGHPIPLWSGVSKPGQKVGTLRGPFGPTTISKLCFRNFQGWTPSLRAHLWQIVIYHVQISAAFLVIISHVMYTTCYLPTYNYSQY